MSEKRLIEIPPDKESRPSGQSIITCQLSFLLLNPTGARQRVQ